MVRAWSVVRVAALLVLAVVGAALSNAAAPTHRKLAWVGSYPRALEVGPEGTAPASPAAPAAAAAVSAGELRSAFPPHPDKAAVEVKPSDVELLYRGKVLFIDARRSSVYAEGHIAGARSLPVWEADVDARVKALYEEGLDQSAPVVVYCSGGNCEDSHMLAEKLYMVGFDNVLIYKDGFPDWQKRNLPVSKGTEP